MDTKYLSSVVPGPAVIWTPAGNANCLAPSRTPPLVPLGVGLSNLFPQILGVVLMAVSLRTTEVGQEGGRVVLGEHIMYLICVLRGLT